MQVKRLVFFCTALVICATTWLSNPISIKAQSYDGLNRHIRIINATSTIIRSVYASTINRNSWQEDILGSSIILPGRSIVANIDDGSGYCRYDLKAVTEDGGVAIRYNVNVCEAASWTITD